MTKRKTGKAESARRADKAVAQAVPEAVVQAAAPVDNATYLQGSFDIHGVESSYREFRGLLASGLPVVIDLSGLNSVDTCGIQLLLALQFEAQRRAVPLTLRGPSPAFDSALHRLGLSDAFATVRRHG
jgi:anti-anti-sigma regulatory factor